MSQINQINKENVLVIGLGRSGEEVALLLKEKKARVTVNDISISEFLLHKKKKLEKEGIKVILGSHDLKLLRGITLVVVSPGVPSDNPLLSQAKSLGIPVIGELELAFRFFPRENLIAITGTNGKSTTTLLTYRILKKSGINVKVGGNIGIPLSRIVRKASSENFTAVVEVSSFQLETANFFSPHIYCILNIFADHLDRHASFSEYRQIKSIPLFNMKKKDFALLNYDQETVSSLKSITEAEVIFFSKYKKLKKGIFIENGSIIANIHGRSLHIPLEELNLQKFHSWENVLCSVGIAVIKGVDDKIIKETLIEYRPLSHRQEFVAEVAGIKFFNDSKATNESAVRALLESLKHPAVLIMGGKDKGGDFSLLRESLLNKAKALVLVGETKEKIKKQLGDVVPTKECENIKEAVRVAFSWCKKGESVVLCPGCSSFDQFINYKHRGNVFKNEVRKLKNEVEGKKLF